MKPASNESELKLADFILLILDVCSLSPLHFIRKIFSKKWLTLESLQKLKEVLALQNQLNFASPCDTLLASFLERVMYGGVAGLVGMTNESHLYEVIDQFPSYFMGLFYIQKRFQVKSGIKLKVWRELQKIRYNSTSSYHGSMQQGVPRKCCEKIVHDARHYRVQRWLSAIHAKEWKECQTLDLGKESYRYMDIYKLRLSETEYFAVIRGREKGKIFENFADVEESIHGLSDSLYYQCSSIEVAEGKIKTWCRRKRKKGWRRLYDKD